MKFRNIKQQQIEYLSNLFLDLYLQLTKSGDQDIAIAMITYIAHIAEAKDLTAAIKHNQFIPEKTRNSYMTAAEFFTNEGRTEGRNERDIEIATNAIRKGYETKDIVDLTGLDIKIVKQLKADLNKDNK